MNSKTQLISHLKKRKKYLALMKFFKVCILIISTFTAVSCQNDSTEASSDADDNSALAVPHAGPIGDGEWSDADIKKLKGAKGKTVEAISFSELQSILDKSGDQLIVCNFWATWCKPCVAEMPYFDKLQDEFDDQNVKVLFVSLDRPKLRETKVTTFVRKKQVRSEVMLLDEKNLSQDEWITKVKKSWEGDIPATIFVKSNANINDFYAGAFDNYEELKKKIIPYLK